MLQSKMQETTSQKLLVSDRITVPNVGRWADNDVFNPFSGTSVVIHITVRLCVSSV